MSANGVEQLARHAFVDFRRVLKLHGIAHDRIHAGRRESQLHLRLHLARRRGTRPLHAPGLPPNVFADSPLITLAAAAASRSSARESAPRRQRERDLVPREVDARNLLEDAARGLENDRVRERDHAPRGGGIARPLSSIRCSRTSPRSMTSPVTLPICTRSPTRMPYLPIRKKYPTTDTSTLCIATARPAVMRPANVASEPSSVANVGRRSRHDHAATRFFAVPAVADAAACSCT